MSGGPAPAPTATPPGLAGDEPRGEAYGDRDQEEEQQHARFFVIGQSSEPNAGAASDFQLVDRGISAGSARTG
jgi:hypothetical protein